MLKEIAPFAVIAAIGNPDLLAVHVILNLIVPHSLSVRVVSVNNLHGTKRAARGAPVNSRFLSNGARR